MVHSEIAQNRSAGAGTGKKYNAIVTKQFYDCAKEALRSTKPKLVHKRWHRKNKIWSHRNDVFFFNGTKEAFRATLVDAAGTVELLLSVWSEGPEMRISCAHYLRVKLLSCCQRENKKSRVAKLFLSL